MTEEHPLIETAHVKFPGVSDQAFEMPSKGEFHKYEVIARRNGYANREFKNQPDRLEVSMQIQRVRDLGVYEDGAHNGQMTLDDAEKDEPDDDAPGGAFTGGPAFSGGE